MERLAGVPGRVVDGARPRAAVGHYSGSGIVRVCPRVETPSLCLSASRDRSSRSLGGTMEKIATRPFVRGARGTSLHANYGRYRTHTLVRDKDHKTCPGYRLSRFGFSVGERYIHGGCQEKASAAPCFSSRHGGGAEGLAKRLRVDNDCISIDNRPITERLMRGDWTRVVIIS